MKAEKYISYLNWTKFFLLRFYEAPAGCSIAFFFHLVKVNRFIDCIKGSAKEQVDIL